MKLPPGLSAPPNSVCKLERSLYGLKQASQQWNHKLCSVLKASGYTQSRADHSLFTKGSSTAFTALLVYVDDLVLAGNDMKEIERVKALLDAKFKIKDLGVLKYVLGFEVARSSQGILLYQRKYAIDFLDEFGLLNAKPTSTPMNYTAPMSKDAGSPLSDLTPYRRLIGSLLYLTNTRPDISFAVNKLSQYLDCATDIHFKAGLHILKYIKGAPARGILFSTASDLYLTGYSDSDWGTCPDTRRSVSGFCFFLGSSIVSWKSRKQLTVACSFAEAEYRALALATCEGRWLTYILRDLQVPLHRPITLFCDNQSAIHIASNPVADILTKSLASGPFAKIHCKLGMHDIHVPSLREADRRESSS
ncbi:uncharacterized mitochondrial protein AtMg00810-like [Arachis stenosperma]|uniref:uncharacterized mitochondrial protein AtMg00810-like n=1 Tax=Arachis stenosperma TaxID=217475 RepID=UPI0025ACC064|nr:uncharacterized mitochondrial protein AtMg00810-like [Arachis stenosperma]